MSMVQTTVIGADLLAETFAGAALALPARVNAVTRTYGALLVTRIQSHASGRPGPNIITGEYVASWDVVFAEGAGGFIEADAGTDAAQGNRLEYGFTGVDSLGRHYHQPPFPHVLPAVHEIEPEYEGAILAAVDEVLA